MWEFDGKIYKAYSEKEMRELRDSQIQSVTKGKSSKETVVDNKKLDEIIELLKDITRRSWL